MHRGYLSLVLHTHLPFVRHPEEEYFLEENWLYEAITETYIPLINVFDRLVAKEATVPIVSCLLEPEIYQLFSLRLIQGIDRIF